MGKCKANAVFTNHGPIFTNQLYPIILNNQYDLRKSLFDFERKAISVLSNDMDGRDDVANEVCTFNDI